MIGFFSYGEMRLKYRVKKYNIFVDSRVSGSKFTAPLPGESACLLHAVESNEDGRREKCRERPN